MSINVLLPAYPMGLGDASDTLEYLKMDFYEVLTLVFPLWHVLDDSSLEARDTVRDCIVDHLSKRYPRLCSTYESARHYANEIVAVVEDVHNAYSGTLKPVMSTRTLEIAVADQINAVSVVRPVGLDLLVRIETRERL